MSSLSGGSSSPASQVGGGINLPQGISIHRYLPAVSFSSSRNYLQMSILRYLGSVFSEVFVSSIHGSLASVFKCVYDYDDNFDDYDDDDDDDDAQGGT